ncbi:MAG: HAD family hydrolase [Kiritimatiellia bacterium]|nr:HAD family hydrolase [Kiritimatiellia bacterium]
MTPRYRHVIWDWNGTLLNDAHLCIACMNRLLEPRGLPLLTPERYQAIFDFPVIDYYRRLGFDLERETFEQLGTAFIDDYERHKTTCALQPEAIEVLDTIRRAGLTQSVLSAYRQDTLDSLVHHYGLRDYFIRVIGAADHYAYGKVETGLSWIRELGLPLEQILLIGDTTHDFEVARALGIACRLVPGGNHSRTRLDACGVPVHDGLREIPVALGL